MLVKAEQFGGVAPKIAPRLLPPTAAQIAVNCKLGSGSLRPWKVPLFVQAPTKTGTKQSLFLYTNQYWFHWLTDVNAVKCPIAGDTWERVYYTGDGVPKMTANDIAVQGGGTNYPNNSYTLGVPAPAASPSAAATGTITNTDVTMIETRAYIYTYVSAYGEEGAPCLASATIDVAPGQSVNLSSMSAAPSGSFNIATKRIYRTNTGDTTTAYQFVAEIPVSNTTYSDTIASAALGEVLPSLDWDMPPASLSGLIALPNGSLAGFYGNQLCFSEPYQPHAWPIKYRMPTDYPLVAIGAFGTSILVTTTGMPYVVTGLEPGSMTSEKAEKGEACVSKRGLVDMGYAVVYPGPDGLWIAGPGILQKATDKIMARDDWQSFNPSSITGCLFDGKYIGFYNNGTPGAFVFDPITQDFTTTDIYATAVFLVQATGKLYLQIGNDINQWDAGATAKTYTWHSKQFQMNRSLSMSAAKVIADAYPVTFKFFSDGVLKLTQTVANARPFRLPSGFLSDSVEFEVSGTNVISGAFVVESMEDFEVGAWQLAQQV
jgi:hypothetical protein